MLRIWPGILLLSSIFFLSPASPADETDDELSDEFALLEEGEEVVESAARHRQQIGMSPSAITVITRQDIETSGAGSVPDLLRLVPGMDVIDVSPFYASIASRLLWGYENNLYLVLIDGREANIEFMGQPLWESQPISIEDIERIEIIRGPGASLYGANAVAGVVSVTTRSVPERTSVWARAAGGEWGNLSLAGRASARFGKLGLSASGGYDTAGMIGDADEPGKKVRKARAVGEYRFSEKEKLLLDAGFSSIEGSIPSMTGTILGTFDMLTVRLAYESETLRGQLYYTNFGADAELDALLDYAGLHLADFVPMNIRGNTLDGQAQWRLPTFWDPLLLIVGGGARLSLLSCDQFLDGATFDDQASSRYQKPGIDYLGIRSGAFAHAELAVADWLTVTGGTRLDYNTETGWFASPRLAAVFRPAAGQFLRLGAARAFRMPAFMEKRLHPMVSFPSDGPIQGGDQDLFQGFMSRVVGNEGLGNEELWSFEAGYRGQFLDDRLSVALDLYCNLYSGIIDMTGTIVAGDRGLPDLDNSDLHFENLEGGHRIMGSELAVRINLTRSLSLLAAWAYRADFDLDSGKSLGNNPKNLITVGGRFLAEAGLLGSLYLFSRSEFTLSGISNPKGLMEDFLVQHMQNVFLLVGRLGWKWSGGNDLQLETGIKLFLPVSPFEAPHFRYYDLGGGITPEGVRYGGQELMRLVTIYFQGSF
ncbi:MAG TPA: TonB-dependent receptor [Myxococcota bacterium]|nr:TonB-dependent receptor [Myxococcota bacterium]